MWLSLGEGKIDDFMVARAILQYLLDLKENKKSGDTVHSICRHASGLYNTQKDGRVLGILKLLEERGLVLSQELASGLLYWSISYDGEQFYKKTVKEFYEILGFTYQKT